MPASELHSANDHRPAPSGDAAARQTAIARRVRVLMLDITAEAEASLTGGEDADCLFNGVAQALCEWFATAAVPGKERILLGSMVAAFSRHADRAIAASISAQPARADPAIGVGALPADRPRCVAAELLRMNAEACERKASTAKSAEAAAGDRGLAILLRLAADLEEQIGGFRMTSYIAATFASAHAANYVLSHDGVDDCDACRSRARRVGKKAFARGLKMGEQMAEHLLGAPVDARVVS